jgi:hypothetical protein
MLGTLGVGATSSFYASHLRAFRCGQRKDCDMVWASLEPKVPRKEVKSNTGALRNTSLRCRIALLPQNLAHASNQQSRSWES